MMSDIGRLILIVGVALALLGALVWALGKLGFRGLPGDISYESENVRFVFPIVTCLVLSALLTLGVWLWNWFRGGGG